MSEEERPELTQEAQLAEVKKKKANTVLNALLIGIVFGVIIYGVAKNNIGFFALIPLFLLFRWIDRSKKA